MKGNDRSRVVAQLGPLLTLAVIAVVFVLTRHGLSLPNLGVILLAPIIYAVFVSDLVSTLITLAIALAYYTYHYSVLESAENVERVVTTALMAAVVVLLFSRLRRRIHDDTLREARVEKAQVEQHRAVAELGQLALESEDPDVVMASACQRITEVLEVPLAKVLELAEDGKTFRLRAGVGWDEDSFDSPVDARSGSQAGYTITVGEPVVVEDLAVEKRFAAPTLLSKHGVASGMSVVIRGHAGRPFGVLGCHAREPHRFSHRDVDFLKSVSNTVASAVERFRAREALRASEELFRQLAEHLGEALFVTTPTQSETLYVNAAFERLFGSSRESLYARPWSWVDSTHPEDQSRVKAAFAGLVETGTFNEEFRIVPPDGEARWIRARISPIVEADGSFQRVVGTATDVTSDKHAHEVEIQLMQERTARAEADAGNRARDEVLAIVSHDLRGPLSGISMTADTMLAAGTAVDSENGRAALRGIKRSVQYMTRLIEDLLCAGQMDAGRFSIEATDVDAAELAHDLVDTLSAEIEKRSLEFALDISPDLPLLRADPERLRQVLWNLIGNAIKFTPAKGSISVSIEPHEKSVVFTVSDTGPGISKEQMPHLFERFWQGKRGDRRGVGLGLPIVKRIVDAHGGHIEVKSQPEQGTTIRFTIPSSNTQRRSEMTTGEAEPRYQRA